MTVRSALVVACVLLGCSGAASAPPTEVIVTEADFAEYESWNRFERGATGISLAHPDGFSTVYVNQLPPHGSATFPIGTIIVRETRAGARETWEVHAMVRRSADYNPLGAVGWEFLDLRLAPEGDSTGPTILWRGEGPTNEGDGYATSVGGIRLGCNHCHGAVPANDSIIGDELQLSSF